MPIEYDAGGDLSNSGKFLDTPGWYHLVVVEGKEVATKKSDGSIIAGMLCQLECVCLDSNVPNQRDKTISICVRAPQATHKDGGDFCRKIADRLWLALSFATREQLESKARLSIDIKQAKGRQFIAKLVKEEGSKWLDVDGAEYYHVDDAAVKDQKKSVDDLNLIRPEFRWKTQPKPAAPVTPPAQTADRDAL